MPHKNSFCKNWITTNGKIIYEKKTFKKVKNVKICELENRKIKNFNGNDINWGPLGSPNANRKL